MEAFLDFEKPITTLEKKLEDLNELSKKDGVDLSEEIVLLEKKLSQLIDETYTKLTRWQRVQLSRHPNRPYTRDYIENLFPSFVEMHGDRCFSNDPAIMAGIAEWQPKKSSKTKSEPMPIFVIGHQKGRTTKQKMLRNFGMAKPEGYRKAMRIMDLAERSRIPILTFIDTPGAYPGIETEERGQAQAIAECISKLFHLTVPVISVVIGEGGSGGALAIGVANRIVMLEYSTYSVISPEGCASILWSDSKVAARASEVLKMNAPDLRKLGVIDRIIKEPKGGAHRDWEGMFRLMSEALSEEITPLLKKFYLAENSGKKETSRKAGKSTNDKMKTERIDKFRKMGAQFIGSATGFKN